MTYFINSLKLILTYPKKSMNNFGRFIHYIHPPRLPVTSRLMIPHRITRAFTSSTGLILDPSDDQPSKEKKAAKPKKSKQQHIIPPEYLAELRSRLSPLPDPDPDPSTTLTLSIESHCPEKVLTQSELQTLHDQLSHSFNLSQLKVYIKSKDIILARRCKKALIIDRIMKEVWKLKSKEELEEELDREMERLEMGETVVVPSRRCELFFLIGQDGSVLRNLEKMTKTKIFFNIEEETYTIKGSTQQEVDSAHAKLSSIVSSLHEEWVEVPWKQETVLDNKMDLIDKEKMTMVNDIIALTGTYIRLDGDKLHIVSNHRTAHDNALRLIITCFNGLGILQTAPPRPPDLRASDISYTAVHAELDRGETKYAFLPMYDSGAMRMVEKNVGSMGGWARVGKIVKATEENKETTLESKGLVTMLNEYWDPVYETLSLENLKKQLEDEKFSGELPEKSELSLEARFGNVLFNTPFIGKSASPSLLRLPIVDTFDRTSLNSWWTSGIGKQMFFPKNPSRAFLQNISVSSPYTKEANALERNRRIVVTEYLNNAFLPWSPLPSKDKMSSLTPRGIIFTFELTDGGNLVPLSIRATYARRTFDILTLNLPVDFRLTAQVEIPLESSLDGNAEENILHHWLKEFKVCGHTDVQCPPIRTAQLLGQADEVTYVLTSIRFERRVKFVMEDSGDVIQVRSIEEHEGPLRRGEVVFAPVPQPLKLIPMKEMWDRFLKGSLDIVNAWN